MCAIHVGRKTEEVATVEVYTDADLAGGARSVKSTSSVFTRIDGFLIGMNAQLHDTHAQSSRESEFYALGAGSADGLYVKAILNDLGMQAEINLYRYVQDLVKTRNRSVASTNRDEPGRHRHETLAESQRGIPQEFDGEDDVPSRLESKATNQTRTQTC